MQLAVCAMQHSPPNGSTIYAQSRSDGRSIDSPLVISSSGDSVRINAG